MALSTDKIFDFLHKYRWPIVIFWILLSGICAIFALGLLNATVWILNPPKGYPSYTAYNQMNKYFPELLNADAEIIVIQLKQNSHLSSINNNITESLCNDINQSLYNLNDPILASLQYFYKFKYENISSAILNRVVAPQFIDPAGEIMIFIISLNVAGQSTQKVNNFIDATQSILANLTS